MKLRVKKFKLNVSENKFASFPAKTYGDIIDEFKRRGLKLDGRGNTTCGRAVRWQDSIVTFLTKSSE